MQSDEHLPADPVGRGCFVSVVSGRATQRNCSYLKEVLLCSDILNKCMVALAISIYSISDLISPFFTSLSLSAVLVERHAFIKCLLFQLFSSHVILLLDYNPRLPPLSCIPCCSLRTPEASVCIHPAQVQLHVMFFVICHMQLLD